MLRRQLRVVLRQLILRRLDVRNLQHWRSSLIGALTAPLPDNLLAALFPARVDRALQRTVRLAPPRHAPMPAVPASPGPSADRWSDGAPRFRCTPFLRSLKTVPRLLRPFPRSGL